MVCEGVEEVKFMSHVIVTDIDHTLLNNQGDLLPENVCALREAISQGNTVLLATARSYAGALPVYKALRLTTPLIVSNGTLITTPEGSIVCIKNILPQKAALTFNIFRQTPHHWVVRVADIAYLHPEFDRYHEPFNNESFYKPLDFEYLNEVLGDFDEVVSLSLYGNNGVKSFYEENNWASLGLRPSYYPPSYYDNRHALSVISKQASKGEALTWLLNDLKLSHLPALIMGDSPDDVSMFHIGTSVAPSSASDAAKDHADWVGPSCDEGLVAAAIKKFL